MIPYMDCRGARARLEAFLDGELGVAEQVALDHHLRWCRTCAARAADLQAIGAVLRAGAPGVASAEDEAGLVFVRHDVLARLRAERDGSWLAWLGRAAGERRLLWPAAGATLALLVCLAGMGAVLRAATLEDPESLAGMIAVLADPGSDRNPVRLGGAIVAPRGLDGAALLDSIPDEEVQLAVAAVVTREGRIANYELLETTRARVRRMQAAAWTDDMDAVLDAVGRARFAPAQRLGGDPVAVSMVWLVTRTTVKSTPVAAAAEALTLADPVELLPVLEDPVPLPLPLPLPLEPEPVTGFPVVATTA